MPETTLARKLYETTLSDPQILEDPQIAHLVIHQNEILSSQVVPGLIVDAQELQDGIRADIRVTEASIIKAPVHLCFGVLPEEGIQKIIMNVDIEDNAKVSILAHCTFPNALDVRHEMQADIRVGKGADYSYFERHVHGFEGGVKVYPTARVQLAEKAKFKTEFELLHGRVGMIHIDYETMCNAHSMMQMTARINGKADDTISINEVGHLVGEGAVGVLISRVALSGRARADVNNRITASSPYARGHVDCKEIVRDEAVATATPIVEVRHPKAHVTHEAAIGSVDMKQLETLMSRGLTEEQASDLIVRGLLS